MNSFEDKKKWLSELKPGDAVGKVGGFSNTATESKVDRITATQIVVGGIKYSKKDGRAIGPYSRFSRPYLVIIDDELRVKMEYENLVSWVCNKNWNQSTITQLRAMKKAHDEAV